MRKETFVKKESKIRIGGKIINSPYIEGEGKITLNDFADLAKIYKEKCWVICKGCGSFISASQKNKSLCYECLNEQKKETSNLWQKNNKEKARELTKRWVGNNKELVKYRQKSRREKRLGLYIYYLMDNFDNVKYVGRSTDMYIRAKQHLNGHVSTTKDFVNSTEFKEIRFANLTNLINKKEQKGLEAYLINTIKTVDLNEDKEAKWYKKFDEEMKNNIDKKIWNMLKIKNMQEWV
ncbi:TPA: GIY-YIG nuclease family protein [Clostridium perfringens]|nr:GIY-YIG nuclease family protein [Clostridium perfringens]